MAKRRSSPPPIPLEGEPGHETPVVVLCPYASQWCTDKPACTVTPQTVVQEWEEIKRRIPIPGSDNPDAIGARRHCALMANHTGCPHALPFTRGKVREERARALIPGSSL